MFPEEGSLEGLLLVRYEPRYQKTHPFPRFQACQSPTFAHVLHLFSDNLPETGSLENLSLLSYFNTKKFFYEKPETCPPKEIQRRARKLNQLRPAPSN